MDALRQKYLNNTISLSEFKQLKEKDASLSDKELDEVLLDSWRDQMNKPQTISDVTENKLKKIIDANTQYKNEHNNNTHLWNRVFKYAAAIIIPLLFASSLYYYSKSNSQIIADTVITTNQGERANITLPDGTKVTLNGLSELKYNALSFNTQHRDIHFVGEGYFKVTHNKEAKFTISSDKIKLIVVGTEFNFKALEKSKLIEILLVKGQVNLISSLQNKSYNLFPQEKAIYNKISGQFAIIKNIKKERASWIHHQFDFKNKPCIEVLKTIEHIYHITIDKKKLEPYFQDEFTGTLPTNNLQETLTILGKTYHVHFFRLNNGLFEIR